MKKVFVNTFVLLSLLACQEGNKPQQEKETVPENTQNAVVETIMKRRSIRSYKPEQIKDQELATIIKCGINAPSALNKQQWEVRVIQSPALLKSINDGFVAYAKDKSMQGSAAKAQQPGFSVFHNAPTLVLVACKKDDTYSAVDCSLLGANMALAAESMNIGSCFVGSVVGYLNTPEAQTVFLPHLNLPEGYGLLYSLALGYKNESPEAKPRDEAKVQIIH